MSDENKENREVFKIMASPAIEEALAEQIKAISKKMSLDETKRADMASPAGLAICCN